MKRPVGSPQTSARFLFLAEPYAACPRRDHCPQARSRLLVQSRSTIAQTPSSFRRRHAVGDRAVLIEKLDSWIAGRIDDEIEPWFASPVGQDDPCGAIHILSDEHAARPSGRSGTNRLDLGVTLRG